MNLSKLRIGMVGMLIAVPTLLFAQDRDVRAERIVLDDAASDGALNTIVIRPPASLTQNLTLTIPDIGTATAEFLLMPSGSGGAWFLGGNAGTTAGTHFLGTTDAQPLHLYVNSGTKNSMILDTNGSVRRDNGGDARGVESVDLQRVRTLSTQVASGLHSTIGGGRENTSSNTYTTVAGGRGNTASDLYATVGGGQLNVASHDRSTVSGGEQNVASGNRSTVGGGSQNIASGDHATVGGGGSDTASNTYATISGGQLNKASGIYATVSGGASNTSSNSYATIAGGTTNIASGTYSTVGGGWQNTASGDRSTVGGGWQNTGSGDRSTVGGGWGNTTLGMYATVAGGQQNAASGDRSTVGGGSQDTASGIYSTVSGGQQNIASGSRAAVGGGTLNNVLGDYSVIPGGRGLTLDASADRSFGFLSNNGGTFPMTISAPDVAVFGNTSLWLANNNNVASHLRFYEANSTTGAFPGATNYSSFQAQTQTSNIQYLLPDTAGIVGDFLNVKAVAGSQITLDWSSTVAGTTGTFDTLTVNDLITVNNALVTGHLTSQGTAPTAVGDGTNLAAGVTVSTTATDVAGLVTATDGGAVGTGVITLSFNTAYTTNPIVVVTPGDAATANAGFFVSGIGTGSFDINIVTTAGDGTTTYSFYYMVVENN